MVLHRWRRLANVLVWILATATPVTGQTPMANTRTWLGWLNKLAVFALPVLVVLGGLTATAVADTQPVISAISPNIAIASDQSTALAVTATGGNLSYQWYTGLSGNTNTPIARATSSIYLVANLANSTNFWVMASNGAGGANSSTVEVQIEPRAANPVLSPPPAFYANAQNVSLTCSTTGAVIRYTLDGSTPNGNSSVFTRPLTLSNRTILTATATAPGTVTSNVSTGTYQFPPVAAWGYDFDGETNVPANLGPVLAIAAGTSHNLAVVGNGTVVGWGLNSLGQTSVPENLTGVSTVAAGNNHSLALLSNGTVVGWGDDSLGQTDVPANLTGVTAISSGFDHNLALLTNGTIVAWGDDSSGQTDVPANLTGVTAVAAGGNHSLALLDNGTVVAWGDNSQGQSSVPGGLTGVTAIAAGAEHSLALLSNGTVVAWGGDDFGQLDPPVGLQNVATIAAGLYHNLVLLTNGTVVAWGDDDQGQTDLPAGLTGVTALAGGGSHSLALLPTAPAILIAPVSATVKAGGNATFTVAAAGLGNLTYQWQKGGVNLPGATKPTLSVSGAGATNAGKYTVVVSNGIGNVTSSTATLTVNIAPSLTKQPTSTTVLVGHRTTLSTAATGTGPLVFQWYYAGKKIKDANNATYSISNTSPANGGLYWVTVTGPFGHDQSNYVTLTVLRTATLPKVTQQPASVSVTKGKKATFTARVSGTPPFTYQWQFNGKNLANGGGISGTTGVKLSIAKVAVANAGKYRVVVTNPAGKVTSASATLKVK
jgi:hypothetical protein